MCACACDTELATSAERPDPGPERQRGESPLGQLFAAHRVAILGNYTLLLAENLLGLAQPLALGLAIGGLLAGSWVGMGLLLAQQMAHLIVGAIRRAVDTRIYTAIYGNLAAGLVLRQRASDLPVSLVAARSGLARQLVVFFERDLPFVLHVGIGVVGAMVLLGCFDPWLVVLCGVALLPATMVGRRHARRAAALNAGLHDELEREVTVIERAAPDEVRGHYRRLASWRVRLSDLEAWNVGWMELVTVFLLTGALVRGCLIGGADAARIATLLGYLNVFVMGVINLPMVLEQWGRLRDIGRRTMALGGVEGPAHFANQLGTGAAEAALVAGAEAQLRPSSG